MKRKECRNCIYSGTNLWGYTECWVLDRAIDTSTTIHTAIRERHALQFNKDGECEFYTAKRFIWLRRLFCSHKAPLTFIRNLYGDEIIQADGCRSAWECPDCGKTFYKDNFISKDRAKNYGRQPSNSGDGREHRRLR